MSTWYVKSSGGSDTAAGSAIGTAWNTIGRAFDMTEGVHVSWGDTLKLIVTSPGDPFDNDTATIIIDHDYDTTNQLSNIMVGCNSSGDIDGTIATIDASTYTVGGEGIIIKPGADDAFEGSVGGNYIFRSIKIKNTTSESSEFPGRGWRINHYYPNDYWNSCSDFIFIDCHTENCADDGFTLNNSQEFAKPRGVYFAGCTSVGCATISGSGGFNVAGHGIHFYACFADNSGGASGRVGFNNDAKRVEWGQTQNGFLGPANNRKVANATFTNCIAANYTGSGGVGFQYFKSLINCVAYNNRDGCRTVKAYVQNVQGQDGIFPVINCIFDSNNEAGASRAINNNWNSDCQPVVSINNAFYDNTKYSSTTKVHPSRNIPGGTEIGIGALTLAASPFVDASINDFRLNNIRGAGRKCRNYAYPAGGQATLTGLSQRSYQDIGAIQSYKPRIVLY